MENKAIHCLEAGFLESLIFIEVETRNEISVKTCEIYSNYVSTITEELSVFMKNVKKQNIEKSEEEKLIKRVWDAGSEIIDKMDLEIEK